MKIIKAIVRTDGSCLNHKNLFVMIPNGHIIDTKTEKGVKMFNHLKSLGFRFSTDPADVVPYIQIVEYKQDATPAPSPDPEPEIISEVLPEPVKEAQDHEAPDAELTEDDGISSEIEKTKTPRKRKSQQ